MSTSEKLSALDEQIRVMLEGLIQHLIEHRDDAKEISIAAMAGEEKIQIEVKNGHVRIAVFHVESKRLYALASYDRYNNQYGLNHRQNLINRFLTDLILLDKMDAI